MKTNAQLEQLVDEYLKIDLDGLTQAEIAQKIESVFGDLDDRDYAVVQSFIKERAAQSYAKADALKRLSRLAKAAGCPEGTPKIPWLLERNLIIKNGEGYAFTPKAMSLRLVSNHADGDGTNIRGAGREQN